MARILRNSDTSQYRKNIKRIRKILETTFLFFLSSKLKEPRFEAEASLRVGALSVQAQDICNLTELQERSILLSLFP